MGNPIDLLPKSPPLFTQQTLMSQLLNAVPDVFLILNQKRQVVYANKALLDKLGISELDTTLGQYPGDLLNCENAVGIHGGCGATDFCRTCGANLAILSGLRGKQDAKECHITQVSGSALDLRVWATPITIDGQVYCLFTIHDISSEKRRRALERIFFHDVLNTAGVIYTYTQMMQFGDIDDLPEKIAEVTKRLIDEITAQKELRSAEDDELLPKPQIIDPNWLLVKIAEQYHGKGLGRGKTIQVVKLPKPVGFISDHTLLQRVLNNLLKNALEASESGDTITIEVKTNGNDIIFSVHNPAYMPRAVQLQVFKRSFSTKGSGRGLGTYSIKLLTERYLHGFASFTSDPEVGTTFQVTYPIKWQGTLDYESDLPLAELYGIS